MAWGFNPRSESFRLNDPIIMSELTLALHERKIACGDIDAGYIPWDIVQKREFRFDAGGLPQILTDTITSAASCVDPSVDPHENEIAITGSVGFMLRVAFKPNGIRRYGGTAWAGGLNADPAVEYIMPNSNSATRFVLPSDIMGPWVFEDAQDVLSAIRTTWHPNIHDNGSQGFPQRLFYSQPSRRFTWINPTPLSGTLYVIANFEEGFGDGRGDVGTYAFGGNATITDVLAANFAANGGGLACWSSWNFTNY